VAFELNRAMLERRDLLKMFAGLTLASTWDLDAFAATTGYPTDQLKKALGPDDGFILVPSDKNFDSWAQGFNLRIKQDTAIVGACNSEQGLSIFLNWAITNNVPFSIRGGGHCYEDFSTSSGLIIDLRGMSQIEVDKNSGILSVQTGARLGDVYAKVAEANRVLPAGSCPSVGIAGHTLGGGYGLLSRALGLACDSLISARLIGANSIPLEVSDQQNADLFWALRGGGQGHFGAVSEFQFNTHVVENFVTFGLSWVTSISGASEVFGAWQRWAPHAPNEIDCLLRLSKASTDKVNVRVFGQSIGSLKNLKSELGILKKVLKPSKESYTSMNFIDAFHHFGGKGVTNEFMKGKSDYLYDEMSDLGIKTMLTTLLKLPGGAVALLCDSYGGAIRDVAKDATAFVHREALYSIQYYSAWSDSTHTKASLANSRAMYEAMRTYVSGFSYVNYCDMDLKKPLEAYWGDNLSRLQNIKQKYDPTNVFTHAQGLK
jgi:FAD/FMN-containing dehydrogenase